MDTDRSNRLSPRPLARLLAAAFLGATALTVPVALTALTARPVRAAAEIDRQYSLDTVGVLRAWDNVDGLFGDYVGAAYREYFGQQSRFAYIDLSKADSVLSTSQIPYGRLIEDEQILKTVSRTLRAQTILRTRVYKEGPTYRFQLDWIHMPKVDVLATDSFTMEEPKGGKAFGIDDVKTRLHAALDRLVKKIPFTAQVTGRDGRSVTVGLTDRASVAKGDTLVLATLEEVKKHPLLKEIVDWRFAETGRVEVESIDGGIAFCKVVDEQPDRQISRFQKVTKIIPPAHKSAAGGGADTTILRDGAAGDGSQSRVSLEDAGGDPLGPPKLGWLSGGLWVGSFSRDYSTGGSSPVTRTGGGLLIGLKAEGQLWLTREWFAEVGLGAGINSYSQKDAVSGSQTSASSVSANAYQFRLDAGYTLLMSNSFYGPKAYGRFGYASTAYSLPTSSSELTSSASWGSLFVGIGGDMPLRDEFGAAFNLDFGVLNSVTEGDNLSGSSTGASNVQFFLGGYYRFRPRMTLRVGLDVSAQSADFGSGASLSHKVFAFGPSLVYLF